MPEGSGTPPPTTGEGGAAGAAGGEPPKQPEPPKKLDLTQEDLDRIIADRVRRAQPADYAELQAIKAEHDAAAEATKTELQKAQDAAKKADEDGKAAIATANQRLVRAEILTAAAAAGAID